MDNIFIIARQIITCNKEILKLEKTIDLYKYYIGKKFS